MSKSVGIGSPKPSNANHATRSISGKSPTLENGMYFPFSSTANSRDRYQTQCTAVVPPRRNLTAWLLSMGVNHNRVKGSMPERSSAFGFRYSPGLASGTFVPAMLIQTRTRWAMASSMSFSLSPPKYSSIALLRVTNVLSLFFKSMTAPRATLRRCRTSAAGLRRVRSVELGAACTVNREPALPLPGWFCASCQALPRN